MLDGIVEVIEKLRCDQLEFLIQCGVRVSQIERVEKLDNPGGFKLYMADGMILNIP